MTRRLKERKKNVYINSKIFGVYSQFEYGRLGSADPVVPTCHCNLDNSSHVYMAEIGKWRLFFVDRPHTEYFGPPFLSRVKIPNQIGQALPHSCRYLLYILYS